MPSTTSQHGPACAGGPQYPTTIEAPQARQACNPVLTTPVGQRLHGVEILAADFHAAVAARIQAASALLRDFGAAQNDGGVPHA